MHVTIVTDKQQKGALGVRLEEKLLSALRREGITCDVYDIEAEQLRACVGCFGCWVKTPGECVIRGDQAAEISRALVQSDLFVLLTPVVYGSVSPAIKRILDRSIGIILPFFRTRNGQMHHALRYREIASLAYIGYGEDVSPAEAETFRQIAKANAVNLCPKHLFTEVVSGQPSKNSLDEIARRLLAFCSSTGLHKGGRQQ